MGACPAATRALVNVSAEPDEHRADASRPVQGTAKRWEAVAGYVRTRTVDEVLDMVKHGLRAGKFAPRQDSFAVAKKRQARPCAPATFAWHLSRYRTVHLACMEGAMEGGARVASTRLR